MAQVNPGELLLYSAHQTTADNRKWALSFDSSPGRTLNEAYSSCAKFLETRANRIAHQCGWGPNSVAAAIRMSFSERDERHVHLARLQTEVPPKLERNVAKLMKYTLPTESAKTQIQAFKAVVDLSTSFPGLRSLSLASRCMHGVAKTKEDISALWDRNDERPPDAKWTFWREFAATCLSDTAITPIVEELPIARLTSCVMDDGGLSIIERLLIAHDCEDSIYAGSLSLRYLAGMLDLPGFWNDMGPVHRDVAKKLCTTLVHVLRDLGCDLVPSIESMQCPSPLFDYEGIDVEGISER